MDIRRYIDNSLLKPTATSREVEDFVRRSEEIGFYGVCLNPFHVRVASEVRKKIVICSVVGFPFGASTKEVKVREAVRAVEDGDGELDVVMNLGAFKGGDYGYVEEEIKAVVRESGVPVKVIIETCFLSREEKVRAVEVCGESGARFVKTSTGFGPKGATEEDVRLLKEVGGGKLLVKAAGGIRDLGTALRMIEAGADRIGTSNGFSIYREASIT